MNINLQQVLLYQMKIKEIKIIKTNMGIIIMEGIKHKKKWEDIKNLILFKICWMFLKKMKIILKNI